MGIHVSLQSFASQVINGRYTCDQVSRTNLAPNQAKLHQQTSTIYQSYLTRTSTTMKYITALFVASATLTSAQVVYNETTNTFSCPTAPNGAFCAGDSLKTNIIIRCSNGFGRPGNCNDNMAGRPPIGLTFSPCFETSISAGDAACSKK